MFAIKHHPALGKTNPALGKFAFAFEPAGRIKSKTLQVRAHGGYDAAGLSRLDFARA